MGQDLSRDEHIDLSAVRLDYDAFRQLALNPNLSAHERVGYPDEYREGREQAIFNDILGKLRSLSEGAGKTLVDIGPGCSNLPRLMIDLCREREHRVILVDSKEMLDQLPDIEGVTVKLPGKFPDNISDVRALVPTGADAVLAYGVMSVVYLDSNPFLFVDAICELLTPGGSALIGDIPNMSKRRRFFASDSGKAFHRAFTGQDEDPIAPFNTPSDGIDDAVLAALVQRSQLAGYDAYILPQGASLPMANRRDDLAIYRP